MGILRRKALALLLVVLPAVSQAECLSVVCNGETTRLYVSINGENPPDPEEGVVLVVLATPLGSCDASTAQRISLPKTRYDDLMKFFVPAIEGLLQKLEEHLEGS